MELTKTETQAIEQAVHAAEMQEVRALDELQLALVGGGIGDVVWG